MSAEKNAPRPTDYTGPENWMNLPHTIDKPVDVFYFCHTGLFSLLEKGEYWPVDDAKWRKGLETGFAVQCGLFTASCNIFAPYCRQFSLSSIVGGQSAEDLKQLYDGVPSDDAEAAFDAYIRLYNNGRPFILFGQSQGAGVIRRLLLSYMEKHPEVRDRLIAAYVIGFSVTEDELTQHPYLRAAKSADDTGVIVSYNTEAPGDDNQNGSILPGALVINPLNWRTDDTYAPASENLASLVTGGGKINIFRGFADAQVVPDRRTIACSTISVEQYCAARELGTFHTIDVALYYANLRENIKTRIGAYLAAK